MTSTYHHGNLRSALLDTAAELARSRGADGVVIREVARRTGVSHNAAYRHFADRESLLAEVAEQGMSRLAEAMTRAVESLDDPDPQVRARQRLRGLGRAYVEYAMAEPGYFDVAFSTSGPPQGAQDDGKAASAEAHDSAAQPTTGDPYALLNAALDDLVSAGVVSPNKRQDAEVGCWAAVHGFALLHLDGPLQDLGPNEREVALDRLLDLIDDGLGVR